MSPAATSAPSFSYMNNFLVNESIAIMMVALGLAVLGFGYARLGTDEGLKLHRWTMSSAIILTFISTGFIMIPSLYLYYAAGADLFSNFSVLQIVHSVEGIPTVALSVMFLFNKLPEPTAKWMKITAVFWLVGIALGAAVYYAMPS